jgi:hypothetical protein
MCSSTLVSVVNGLRRLISFLSGEGLMEPNQLTFEYNCLICVLLRASEVQSTLELRVKWIHPVESADLQGTTRRREARRDSVCGRHRKHLSTDHVYRSNLIGHVPRIHRCNLGKFTSQHFTWYSSDKPPGMVGLFTQSGVHRDN